MVAICALICLLQIWIKERRDGIVLGIASIGIVGCAIWSGGFDEFCSFMHWLLSKPYKKSFDSWACDLSRSWRVSNHNRSFDSMAQIESP